MNETTLASIMVLVRVIVTALGGVLTAKGWLTEQDLQLYLGAILMIVPAAWGVYERIRVSRQKVDAVNAGIVLANQTHEPTPLVSTPAEAREVIATATQQPTTEGTKP